MLASACLECLRVAWAVGVGTGNKSPSRERHARLISLHAGAGVGESTSDFLSSSDNIAPHRDTTENNTIRLPLTGSPQFKLTPMVYCAVVVWEGAEFVGDSHMNLGQIYGTIRCAPSVQAKNNELWQCHVQHDGDSVAHDSHPREPPHRVPPSSGETFQKVRKETFRYCCCSCVETNMRLLRAGLLDGGRGYLPAF